MNMIGHEAVADHRRVPFIRINFQKVKIYISVFSAKKYGGTIIASLDYMMRESRINHPGNS